MFSFLKNLRPWNDDSGNSGAFSAGGQIDDLWSSDPAEAPALKPPAAPFAGSLSGIQPLGPVDPVAGHSFVGPSATPFFGSTTAATSLTMTSTATATQAAATTAAVNPDARVSSPGGSGLVFNNNFDSSCSAQFEACVVAAEKTLEGLFTNPAVFNVNFSEQNQGNNGDALENSAGGEVLVVNDSDLWAYPLGTIPYSIFKAALPSSDVLPSTLPNGYLELPEAYARMLGLSTNTDSPDASVTLNSFYNWSFGQDVTNGVIHELTENLMGRVGGLGDPGNVLGLDGLRGPMDLFRYTAAGAPDYSDGRDGQTTYFSSDGGKTTSQSAGLSFNNEYNTSGNQVNEGDTSDFTQQDVFGTTGSGETNSLTQTDLNIMAALGWKPQMSQDYYTAASGNWQTPTNWSSNVTDGAQPIEPQDAFIGFAYTSTGAAATSLNDVTVNSIGTSAASTLTIAGGSTLTATNGTVLNPSDEVLTASGNNGTIVIENSSGLSVGNSFVNSGSLTVESGSIFSDSGAYTNSGKFQVGGNSFAGLSGVVSNSGSIGVDVGVTLALGGAVQNQGAMTIGAQITGSSGQGLLFLDKPTTLAGGGAINLGQITVGFSTDVATTGGGGTGPGGGGHPIAFETAGEIESFSALVNADNTISGSGLVSVASLDNQAKASIGATFAGHGVQILSRTIRNEGDLFADGQTTLELGFDGVTVTLANAGRIELGAGADLSLSGNVAAFDAGSINFNGAGGALTSDGAGPTTFTTENAIVATASAQIGDQGLKSANDLTLINENSIIAEFSGVTLTLNTGANTITDIGGLLEARSGAQLTIDSAVKIDAFAPIGSNVFVPGTIEAASGGVVNINGNVTTFNQRNGQIVIAGGTVNVANGVSIGVPVVFTSAGGALNLTNTPVDIDVSGAGGAINLSDNARADVTGAGFTVTEAGTDSLAIGGNGVGGAADVVKSSGETVTTHSSSNVSVVGSNDTVNVGVTNALSLQGGTDVLNLHQLFGDLTVNGFGASDVMHFSTSDFASFQAMRNHMTQMGANTMITLDSHDAIDLANVAMTSLTASQFRFA